MKLFILVFIVFSPVLGNLELEDPVGTKCESQGVFAIRTCNVSPFPPKSGSTALVSLTGNFTSAASVGQIRYSLQGYKMWNYQYQDINKNYAVNTTQTFNYTLNIPQYSDYWLVQITVMPPDSHTIYGCWEFAFLD